MRGQAVQLHQAAMSELATLALTEQQLRMIEFDPQGSELLHEWLGVKGGRVEYDKSGVDPYLADDPHYYAGRIMVGEQVEATFAYRIAPFGIVWTGLYRAVEWVFSAKEPHAAFLSGRKQFVSAPSVV